MRKLIAMTMAAIIVMISGVPMSLAKACATPSHEDHAMQSMHHGNGHTVQSARHGNGLVTHHQQAKPPLTERQVSIAHCCNFHGAIDTLPHLLAPFVLDSDIAMKSETVEIRVSFYSETAWPVPKNRVPLPPPQHH